MLSRNDGCLPEYAGGCGCGCASSISKSDWTSSSGSESRGHSGCSRKVASVKVGAYELCQKEFESLAVGQPTKACAQ